MPKNRRYNAGGSLNLGAILGAIYGVPTTGEVEQVPQIAPQGPTQEGGILQPEPTQFRVKANTKDSSGKGQSIANEANTRSILSEDEAKRGLRTKQSEIPIDVEREQELNKERLKQSEALGHIATNEELQRELGLIPIQVDRARQLHQLSVVASKGIQPTKQNVKSQDELQTNIDLSRQAEEGYEGIDKARLGREELSKGLEISTKTRPDAVFEAAKKARHANIAASDELEIQPELHKQRKEIVSGMAERQNYEDIRNRLFPTRFGESAMDIKTKLPAFTAPLSPEQQMYKDAQDKAKGIQTKAPSRSNIIPQVTPQVETPDIQPDPNNPDNVIITIGGKRISVPKGTP